MQSTLTPVFTTRLVHFAAQSRLEPQNTAHTHKLICKKNIQVYGYRIAPQSAWAYFFVCAFYYLMFAFNPGLVHKVQEEISCTVLVNLMCLLSFGLSDVLSL